MVQQALKEHVDEMMSKSKEALIKSSIKSGSSSGPQEGSVKGGGLKKKGQGAAVAHSSNIRVLSPTTHEFKLL